MKQYTIPQIIEISKKLSISNFEQADEIAWYFHDQRITYVPSGNLHMGFYRMIMTIWTAGYISGVQAEREKQRNRKKRIGGKMAMELKINPLPTMKLATIWRPKL